MLLQVLVLLVGFALLIKGADWFVDGAAGLARRLKIPQLVIGLTIVAMGTSMPEAAVSVTAAMDSTPGIAIGNVVGSNILNILLILGVTACMTTLNLRASTLWIEIPFLIAVTALLLVFGVTGSAITFWEGIIFLALFLVYLGYLAVLAKREKEKEESVQEIPLWKSLVFMILGGVMVVKGSDLAVDSACRLLDVAGGLLRHQSAVHRSDHRGVGHVAAGTGDLRGGRPQGERGHCHRQHCGQQYFQHPVHPGHCIRHLRNPL